MSFSEKYTTGVIISTIIMIFTFPIHIVIYKLFPTQFEMFFGVEVGTFNVFKYIIVWQIVALIVAISIRKKDK